jgi:dTDP-4-dehydrorhamnose reductase
VGGALFKACSQSGLDVRGTARKTPGLLPLDLADPATINAAFAQARPQLVFLCSAMTNVDACELDPGLARRVNGQGAAAAAAQCAALNAKLVYLSTEYVFDGKAGPYAEDAPVNPLSVYGRTKLEGERAALAAGALVIRTTVVYSYSPGSKNFIMQLIANRKAGAKMRVPADQFSNPTHAPDLARAVLELAQKGASGVFNVVGPNWLNRYDFALKACAAFGFSADFVEPAATAALGQAAPRPLQAGLRTQKLQAFLGRALPQTEQSLGEIAAMLKL